MTKDAYRCECCDAGCPTHGTTCPERGVIILYRVDMEDIGGTLFCAACADDALMSGLFRDADDEDDGEEVKV